MKLAIVFLTKKSNDWTLKVYYALEQSMQMDADVYFVYHQQGEELPVSLQSVQNLFTFTSDILQDLSYTPIEEGKLVPGSNHFPLLKFFREHQEYDYYWMVEDDVRFCGEWKVFFDNFSTNHADFLSSIIETKKENPNWFWWSYLKTGNENVSEEQLLKSFNPIYRLSHQALACIDEHLRNGWMGHHEILIPTLLNYRGFQIEDFGGNSSFTKEENRNKFYDKTSMSLNPLIPNGRKNYLFHPVKEEKVRKDGPYKKNAVFVAAGKDSLHRQLLKGEADFDLHLLIYDDSYNKFCNDSDFICADAGYKMDMTYRYLHRHPELIEKYEYFFLMDDDIEMSTKEVNKLFRMMRGYNLKIAQPSLVMSYYTYEHTLHNPLCILRYTNFVEMMVPCFSRDALTKVLPTFEKKVRGCGIEFHWPMLINTNQQDMAILDEICATHIRPLQPWSDEDEYHTQEYLRHHGLSRDVVEYSCIAKNQPTEKRLGCVITEKKEFDDFRATITECTDMTVMSLKGKVMSSEILPLSLLTYLTSAITEKRRYADFSYMLLGKVVMKVHELDGRITNEPLLFRYLAASDPFDDEQCKECILLPVCGGGCPYERIKRDYEDNKINVCPLIKGNLKNYLLNHYTIKKK